MRRVVDKYPGNPVLISEADEPNIAELTKMYGSKDDEVQLPMDFQIADVNRLSAPDFRKLLDEIDRTRPAGKPHYFFSNHDQAAPVGSLRRRRPQRSDCQTHGGSSSHTRATPLMYYGEEIGMRTTTPARKEGRPGSDREDRLAEEKGRDGERTPMQWTRRRTPGSARRSALGCLCRPAQPNTM